MIDKIEEALIARKNFYEFLSEAYLSGVSQKFVQDIRSGAFFLPSTKNTDIQRGFEELYEYINKPLSIEELIREIEDEYVRLFLGPGKVEVLPYQSTYEGHPIYGETTLMLKSILAEAGLRISRKAGVGEDHIGVELKFMAYLCQSALDSLTNGKNVMAILEKQKKFLEENMLPWVEKLCDDVLRSSTAKFYRGLARITRGFLREDRVLLYELIALL